jgi:hypothetical protein
MIDIQVLQCFFYESPMTLYYRPLRDNSELNYCGWCGFIVALQAGISCLATGLAYADRRARAEKIGETG